MICCSDSSISLARFRFTEPRPGPWPADPDARPTTAEGFAGEAEARPRRWNGIAFVGDCVAVRTPLGPGVFFGTTFRALTKTGGPMLPGTRAGVCRTGVEGRNGLNRSRASSLGAVLPGVLTVVAVVGFRGETDTKTVFLRGEMMGLDGDRRADEGGMGWWIRPERIEATSAVDVADDTVRIEDAIEEVETVRVP